jgi:hypothetical protein
LAFTDRDALALLERLLSRAGDCTHRGRVLQVLTVYATQHNQAEGWGLHLALTFDDLSADWPYLLCRDLLLEPDAHLDGLLESHLPDVDPKERDPIFTSLSFKRPLQRVLNAILYATNAEVAAEARRLPSPSQPPRSAQEAVAGHSAEEVYYLPGHIDIRELRQLQAVDRAPGGRALMHRFLVRGHWRRPGPSWKGLHLRWIRPYRKGPDMAALVERAYRLRAQREMSEAE